MPTSADCERMLREAGLRVTRPRAAVLAAVHAHPHTDTESVIRLVREALGEVSQQAVYDVLRALTTARLLRRFEPSGSVARYEARVGDNHHHVVCRSCGAIADVDCAVGETPCLTADHSSYDIDEAEVIYWGRCPDCAQVAAADAQRPAGAQRDATRSAALVTERTDAFSQEQEQRNRKGPT